MAKSTVQSGLTVKAYQGDARTLLAFNLPDRKSAKNLAGFTIQCTPEGSKSYYLFNTLQFQTPGNHAQVATEPVTSSVNAPIRKFRWLHVPGSVHQGTTPLFGKYTYTVTPRFFDGKGSLLAIDPSLSVSVKATVQPFKKNGLELGFTRGYTQSQAFDNHFGIKALIRPKTDDLLFDTTQQSGVNNQGVKYTYQDEYTWLGFTARQKIFDLLNQVLKDKTLSLSMFAYDLNEPDILQILLQLAKQGRVRIILDDATLHHNTTKPTSEDKFTDLFNKAATKGAAIMRGHFGRYAHDKIFIVANKTGAIQVLTGSTNFSVTGMYVNSNHVLVFNDPAVAAKYAEVFEASWTGEVKAPAFASSALAATPASFKSKSTPPTTITFSPHTEPVATKVLQVLVDRINLESKQKGKGSVLFAVMDDSKGTGPVLPALQKLHENLSIFSYGVSDATDGISLYKPGSTQGVLVTGKPSNAILPPPFNQVRSIGGVGHQIHHKFVVCGFNRPDAVVYCGSSNLALGGETANGDNLIAIQDQDVATAFAIEAIGLIDHFNFLDNCATGGKGSPKPGAAPAKPLKTGSKSHAATEAGWFLLTDDKWVDAYYDKNDLHCVDRLLFA